MFDYVINKISTAYAENEARPVTDTILVSSIVSTCLGFGVKSYHEHETKCDTCKQKTSLC